MDRRRWTTCFAGENPRTQSIPVDDEPALASLAKMLLERIGYVVTTQTNPLEAIATVRDHPDGFDLVITDLTMPGLDGVKLGSQLRSLQPALPIILMTGYSGMMTSEKVRALGFLELMHKPFNASTLGETLQRVLQASAPPKT